MKIYLTFDSDYKSKIYSKLKKSFHEFKIDSTVKGKITLSKKGEFDENTMNDYHNNLNMIKGIRSVNIHRDEKNKDGKGKSKHIFFDIDSTLTERGIETIDPTVRDVFNDLNEYGCRLYFCTGRSFQKVTELMENYQLNNAYSIAEGGGIIIGFKTNGTNIDKTSEVKKFRKFMLTKYKKTIEDPNQRNRRSEYVILKELISEEQLVDDIRESKSKVEFHASINTYHISAKGINKGAGIRYLKQELSISPRYDLTIGVGDSDLDKPMFQACDECYIVKNTKENIVTCDKCYTLSQKAPHAITELRNLLFEPSYW